MSTVYSSRLWACPFLKWDERLKVHCEGGCCVSFPDARARAGYIAQYCANMQGWQGCTIAAALLDYYDRRDDTDGTKRG